MKLKKLYETVYNKIFSVGVFRKLLKIPFLEKLLQYEVLSYLVFGALTTAVNFIVYYLSNKPFGENYEQRVLFSIGAVDVKWIYISQAVAWVVSVLFAFVTNKLFVFESRTRKISVVLRELVSFFGARILSFVLFEELLFALLTWLFSGVRHAGWIAKILVAVFVIVFNYIASKLVIFRKKKENGEKPC